MRLSVYHSRAGGSMPCARVLRLTGRHQAHSFPLLNIFLPHLPRIMRAQRMKQGFLLCRAFALPPPREGKNLPFSSLPHFPLPMKSAALVSPQPRRFSVVRSLALLRQRVRCRSSAGAVSHRGIQTQGSRKHIVFVVEHNPLSTGQQAGRRSPCLCCILVYLRFLLRHHAPAQHTPSSASQTVRRLPSPVFGRFATFGA